MDQDRSASLMSATEQHVVCSVQCRRGLGVACGKFPTKLCYSYLYLALCTILIFFIGQPGLGKGAKPLSCPPKEWWNGRCLRESENDAKWWSRQTIGGCVLQFTLYIYNCGQHVNIKVHAIHYSWECWNRLTAKYNIGTVWLLLWLVLFHRSSVTLIWPSLDTLWMASKGAHHTVSWPTLGQEIATSITEPMFVLASCCRDVTPNVCWI